MHSYWLGLRVRSRKMQLRQPVAASSKTWCLSRCWNAGVDFSSCRWKGHEKLFTLLQGLAPTAWVKHRLLVLSHCLTLKAVPREMRPPWPPSWQPWQWGHVDIHLWFYPWRHPHLASYVIIWLPLQHRAFLSSSPVPHLMARLHVWPPLQSLITTYYRCFLCVYHLRLY